MNRWRMHKLGFINFWLYDREEFLLEDGHILLRGANASGKSITTQSFIPFLLDGNRSPERLDPFGSRDRKMDYYLLGDGESDESTAYLYLEFRREESADYLTIGIGMRAQKGKGIVDFWGFCVHDGRRIGEDAICLYETMGRQMVPLSKLKLRNLLNDPDNWAESPGTYKQLVNDRVFQFRDIRQYEQLVNLLIKVRAPKLSKEAFRPTEVKKILADSLQVLTDEDLSAMVSTMEQMDTLRETLADYHTAIQDARTIRNEYTRYNQFMLGMKGNAYWEALHKKERLENQLKDAQGVLAAQTAELERQTQAADTAAAALAQAKAQRTALGEDDLSAKQDQLKEAQARAAGLTQRIDGEKRRLEELQAAIEKNEVKLRTNALEQENARFALHRDIRQLEELEETLGLGEEHRQYCALLGQEQVTEQDHQGIQSTLSRRKKTIVENLDCLQKVEEARMRYSDACGALDQAETAMAAVRVTLRDAQQQEQEERDALTEHLVQRKTLNQELLLSDEEVFTLRQAVTRYRSAADWSSVRQLIDDCHTRNQSALLKEQVSADAKLRESTARASELGQALNRLRQQTVPVPERRPQQENTRVFLAMQGIPHAAFYETVEFAPGLPQAARDLLEAQLRDAGLLDALVVPETERARLTELLLDYPDCIVTPGTPVSDPIQGLIPDERSPMRDIVGPYLRGISASDLQARTALLPDGSFRNGILQGQSLAAGSAGFVGASARRANLERQIAELEDCLTAADTQRRQDEALVATLQHRLERLQEERSLMPNTVDLDQALDLLEQARKKVEEAEREKERCEVAEQTAKRLLGALEQESRALSAGLPYAKTVPAFSEAAAAAGEYGERLPSLRSDCETLRFTIVLAEQLEDTIANGREDADQRRLLIRSDCMALDTEEAKVAALQAFLNQPENQARVQKLQELAAEIETQQSRFSEAEKCCVALGENSKESRRNIQRDQDILRDAVMREIDLERYFSEELALGFASEPTHMDLPQRARQAYSKIRATDREGTPETLGAALSRNYQEHNNSLLRYMPRIETIFDAPSQLGMLRQRLQITLQWDGKPLALDAFIQTLQEQADTTETVLQEKDRELFENILNETISHKLRARIEESQQWSRDMSALMKLLVTSMGLTFSLDWRAKKAETAEELDTAQLVQLLNKDRDLLTPEDIQRTSLHFRTKIKAARQNAEQRELGMGYADLIRQVLDYRTWYEFTIYYQREGQEKKELTDRIFNKFSGGEKAMAIYLPQFAAVSAQYQKGGASCPMLLALDEAFAGVDEKNIGAMFELVHSLGFDYIMNSQALWGCYSCVSSLDIAEFHRPNNAPVVTLLRYHWNGTRKRLLEE